MTRFFAFSQITTVQKLLLSLILLLFCVAYSNVEACTLNKAKEKNELVGPVHTVITKMRFYITTDTYDQSGNLIESLVDWSYESDRNQSKTVFTCDQEGRLTMEVTSNSDGSLPSRKVYWYGFDERGNQTAMVATMHDGSFAHVEFSIYDDKGNLAAKLYYTGGTGGFYDKSVFDAQGKVVAAIRYQGKTLLFKSVKRYNPQGQLAESLYYGPDDTLTRTDQYRYDDSGRQIEESSKFNVNFRLSKAVTRYEYDDAGNWIRKLVQEWKQGADLTKSAPFELFQERTIAYY